MWYLEYSYKGIEGINSQYHGYHVTNMEAKISEKLNAVNMNSHYKQTLFKWKQNKNTSVLIHQSSLISNLRQAWVSKNLKVIV